MSKIWQHNCPYFSSALIQWKCKINKYSFTPYTKLHLISVPLQKSSVLEGIGHSHTRTQRVTFKKIGPPSPFLFEMRKNLHWEWLHLEKHTYLHMINKRPMGLSVFPFKITPVQKSSLKIHFYSFFCCKSTFLAKWPPSKLIFLYQNLQREPLQCISMDTIPQQLKGNINIKNKITNNININ